jgi:hypothetical protein
MKTLATTDLVSTFNLKGILAVLRQLEEILRTMNFPDVEGIPIYSLIGNIVGDGHGNFTITVDTVANSIYFAGDTPLYLRNYDGLLQVSTDNLSWSAVGAGGSGSGDMLKSAYDTDENGIVDQAEELSDGSNSATAAQVRGHLDNSALHAGGDMLQSVYDSNNDGIVSYASAVKGEDFFGNAKTYTMVDLAGHIDNPTLHVPDGNYLPLTNRTDNPDADASFGRLYLKNDNLYVRLPDGTIKQISFVA